MRITPRSAILSCSLVLTACGGGGGDAGSPSDALFADFGSVYGGGFRATQGEGVETPEKALESCGYVLPLTRQAVEDPIRVWGGRVLEASEHRYCAVVDAAEYCLTRLGEGAFVFHQRGGDNPTMDRVQAFVAAGPDHYLMFESVTALTGPSAAMLSNGVNALRRDAAIPPSGNCSTPAPSPLTAESLDGRWTGVRVLYDRANRTGHVEPHEMECNAQFCVVTTRPSAGLDYASFEPPGVWRADAGEVLSGATMTRDGEALALWRCPAASQDADRTQFKPECELYGFRRSGG